MRCEQCGRDMKNAELWQLATDPKAPTSWSMRHSAGIVEQHPEKALGEREPAGMRPGNDADGSAMPESLPARHHSTMTVRRQSSSL